MGLDKILELIIEWIEKLLPFFIVKTWQKAVILRLGKIQRTCDPGFHWRIPFVDENINLIVVTTTMETSAQTLVTADGQDVTLQAVIKYSISDVVAYSTDIYDATDAIMDFTMGTIMREVNNHTYDECRDVEAVSNTISKKVRAEVKKYGIHIDQITLTNFIKTRNYRIFRDMGGEIE